MANTQSQKLDQILEEIRQMRAENAERDKAAAVRDEKLCTVIKDVESHSEILQGNGKNGLKTEVSIMKDRIDAAVLWTRALALLVIGQVLALIIGILTHTLKLGT